MSFAVPVLMPLALFAFRTESNLFDKHNKKIYQKIYSFFEPFEQIDEEAFTKEEIAVFKDILPIYDSIGYYNNFIGKIDDINIKFSTVKCSISNGRSNGRSYTVKFEGIIIKLSSNKKISGKVIVVKDDGKIANTLNQPINPMFRAALSKAELEDPEFERHFDVYATDQVEARYILTPAFIQRLLNVNKMIYNKLTFAFADNSIYLAIPTSINIKLEFSMLSNISYLDVIRGIYKNFDLIYKIIEKLKLKDEI